MTPDALIPLRPTYSLASTDAVAAFLATTYDLCGPLACTLARRGFNDSYAVEAADGRRYVFRISGWRSRGAADVAAETAFLAHLDRIGVPVGVPVPTRDGALHGDAPLTEGPRAAVLFHHLDGRLPKQESMDDARAQGATLARIHAAAAGYADWQRHLYRLDVDALLHRPAAAVFAVKALSADARTRLTALTTRLGTLIAGIDGLSWTRCHADCHGGNAFILTEGPQAGQAAFFDFDDGGPGYLAYDLSVYLWAKTFFQNRDYHAWHAFIAGYLSVRPIQPGDFIAVPAFAAVRHIWLMGEYAAHIHEWGTDSLPATWLTRQVEVLEAWEREKLSPDLLHHPSIPGEPRP